MDNKKSLQQTILIQQGLILAAFIPYLVRFAVSGSRQAIFLFITSRTGIPKGFILILPILGFIVLHIISFIRPSWILFGRETIRKRWQVAMGVIIVLIGILFIIVANIGLTLSTRLSYLLVLSWWMILFAIVILPLERKKPGGFTRRGDQVIVVSIALAVSLGVSYLVIGLHEMNQFSFVATGVSNLTSTEQSPAIAVPSTEQSPDIAVPSTDQSPDIAVPSTLPFETLFSLFDRVSILNSTGICLPPTPNITETMSYLDLHWALDTLWLDGNGIMIINYGEYGASAGWRYTPNNISLLGMVGINAYCNTGDLLGLKIAVTQGNWLVDNAIRFDNNFAIWVYRFANPPLGLPKNWTSGLGNGYGAAFLLRLYSLTGDPKYLEVSRLAVQSMQVRTEEYGVRSVFEDGRTVFFEEGAHPDASSDAHILNGHLFALEALDYVAKYTHDPILTEEASKRIDDIANYIGKFDADVTNLYSLSPELTRPRDYYVARVHIQALMWAYTRSPNPVFLKYALKWMQQQWNAPEVDLFISSSKDNVFPGTLYVQNPDFSLHSNTPRKIRDLVGPETDTFVLDLKKVLPLRSFGYASSWGRYPTDYTLATSTDGKTWQSIVHVQDYEQSHALFFLEDEPARYVKLFIEKASTFEGVRLGPIRADIASYWEHPIILLVNNGYTEVLASDNLSDDDPTTSMTLKSGNDVLYGDLQKLSRPKYLVLSGKSATKSVRTKVFLEVSNDLEKWTTVLGEGSASATAIPGRIELPTDIAPWRYFRLSIESESDIKLSEFEVVGGNNPRPVSENK